jgi:hypothetical protein
MIHGNTLPHVSAIRPLDDVAAFERWRTGGGARPVRRSDLSESGKSSAGRCR